MEPKGIEPTDNSEIDDRRMAQAPTGANESLPPGSGPSSASPLLATTASSSRRLSTLSASAAADGGGGRQSRSASTAVGLPAVLSSKTPSSQCASPNVNDNGHKDKDNSNEPTFSARSALTGVPPLRASAVFDAQPHTDGGLSNYARMRQQQIPYATTDDVLAAAAPPVCRLFQTRAGGNSTPTAGGMRHRHHDAHDERPRHHHHHHNHHDHVQHHHDQTDDKDGGFYFRDSEAAAVLTDEDVQLVERDSFGNVVYQRVFRGDPFADEEAAAATQPSGAARPVDPETDVPPELRKISPSGVRFHYFDFVNTRYFWFLVEWALRVSCISILVPAVLINLHLKHTPFISDTFALTSVVIAVGVNFGQSFMFFVQYIKAGCIWLPVATLCYVAQLQRSKVAWYFVYTIVLFLFAVFTEKTTRRMCLLLYCVCMVNLLLGNDDYEYPSRVLADWFIGAAFALVSSLIPYPMLATRTSSKISRKIFSATANCFTGILVCFWAPSNTERSMSMVRIRNLVRTVDHLIDKFDTYDVFTFYEMLFFERFERREVRREKIKLLSKLKMNLRAMERVINMVQERPQMLDQSERCMLFRKHLSEPMEEISRATEALLYSISSCKLYADLQKLSNYFENCGKSIKGLQEEFEQARRILFYENEEPRHFAGPYEQQYLNFDTMAYAQSKSPLGVNPSAPAPGGDGFGAGMTWAGAAAPAAAPGASPSTASPLRNRRESHRAGTFNEFLPHGPQKSRVATYCDDNERMEEFVPLLTFFVFSVVNFWSTLSDFETFVDRHKPIKDWRDSFRMIGNSMIEPFKENALLIKHLCVRRAEPEVRVVIEAAKVSVAMLVSVLFFYYVDSQRLLLSGPTIIAFVSGTNPVEAMKASAARLTGTLFGSVLGFFAASLCHNAVDRIASLCVITFVMTFFRTNKVVGIVCMYCNYVAVSSLGPSSTTSDQTISRIQQNSFAICIYCFISLTFFPVSPGHELYKKRLTVVRNVSGTIKRLMGLLREASACYVEVEHQVQMNTEGVGEAGGMSGAGATGAALSRGNSGPLTSFSLRHSSSSSSSSDGAGNVIHNEAASGSPNGSPSGEFPPEQVTRQRSRLFVPATLRSNGAIVAMNNSAAFLPPNGEQNGLSLSDSFGMQLNDANDNIGNLATMPRAFVMAPEDTTIQGIFKDVFATLELMKTTTSIMPLAAGEFHVVPYEYPLRASNDVQAALYRVCALVYTMACCWKAMREKGYFTTEMIHIFHNLAPLAIDITQCLERFSHILDFYMHHPSSRLSSELTKGVMQLRVLSVELSARKERNFLVVIRKTRAEKGIHHVHAGTNVGSTNDVSGADSPSGGDSAGRGTYDAVASGGGGGGGGGTADGSGDAATSSSARYGGGSGEPSSQDYPSARKSSNSRNIGESPSNRGSPHDESGASSAARGDERSVFVPDEMNPSQSAMITNETRIFGRDNVALEAARAVRRTPREDHASSQSAEASASSLSRDLVAPHDSASGYPLHHAPTMPQSLRQMSWDTLPQPASRLQRARSSVSVSSLQSHEPLLGSRAHSGFAFAGHGDDADMSVASRRAQQLRDELHRSHLRRLWRSRSSADMLDGFRPIGSSTNISGGLTRMSSHHSISGDGGTSLVASGQDHGSADNVSSSHHRRTHTGEWSGPHRTPTWESTDEAKTTATRMTASAEQPVVYDSHHHHHHRQHRHHRHRHSDSDRTLPLQQPTEGETRGRDASGLHRQREEHAVAGGDDEEPDTDADQSNALGQSEHSLPYGRHRADLPDHADEMTEVKVVERARGPSRANALMRTRAEESAGSSSPLALEMDRRRRAEQGKAPVPACSDDADRYTLKDSSSSGSSSSSRTSSRDSSSTSSSRSSSSSSSSSNAFTPLLVQNTTSSLVQFNESFTTPVTNLDAEGLHAFTLSLEMLSRELRKVLFGLEEMIQSG